MAFRRAAREDERAWLLKIFTDDGALPFTSRADLEFGLRLLKELLLRFAREVHYAVPTLSLSERM